MILVLGSTGRIGSQVVQQLADLDVPVRALTRRPADAPFPASVEVAEGSADDEQGLSRALEGVRSIFVVLVDPIESHAAKLATAVQTAGRPLRIVLLSSSAVLHPVRHQIGEDHQSAERLLLEVADTWTILRPGPFHSNALWWARSVSQVGHARCLVGNQKVAPISPEDVAAIAVKALTEDGHHGRAYELTGPELLSSQDQVSIVAELLGRPITFEVATKQQAVDAFAAISGDIATAETNIDALHSPQCPWTRINDNASTLLGRSPQTFARWAAKHADRFDSVGTTPNSPESRTA